MLRSFVPGSTTSVPSILGRSVPRIPISVVFMHIPLHGFVCIADSVVADVNRQAGCCRVSADLAGRDVIGVI